LRNTPMLDHTDEDEALGKAQVLRDDAEYASLTRHAVTDNGRTLIDPVRQQIDDLVLSRGW